MAGSPHGAGRVSGALRGRRCVVTGASSGLGQAIAEGLASGGAAVVGFARRFEPERLDRWPAPGALARVRLDVTDAMAVRARFAELGALDALVLSAGLGRFGPAASAALGDVRAMLEVGVVGTLSCVQAALPVMAPGAHVVSIGSIATRETFVDCAGYTAAKAGQAALLRVLREETRAAGVRVTDLVVGATDTPLWDARAGFDRACMMDPRDVAGVVVDLLARPGVAVDELTVVPPGGNL